MMAPGSRGGQWLWCLPGPWVGLCGSAFALAIHVVAVVKLRVA